MHKPIYIYGIECQLGEMLHINLLQEPVVSQETTNFMHQYGIAHYSKLHQKLEEAVLLSVDKTLETTTIDPDTIGAIVLCSTSFEPYSQQGIISQIAAKYSIQNALPFGVFIGQCTNYSLGLVLCRALLEQDDHHNILFISADKLREDLASRVVPNRTSVFSDSVVSCIVTTTPPTRGYKLLDVKHSYLPHTFNITPDKDIINYVTSYTQGFNLAIEKLRSSLPLNIHDYKKVVAGNFNYTVLRNIAALLQCPFETLYTDNVARYGHCFSADQLISANALLEDTHTVVGDTLLLVGAGGQLWSAVALSKC